MLTGVVSGPDEPEVRTFECSLCNCTEKVTVEMKWRKAVSDNLTAATAVTI
jgi:hypothetical protein